MTPDDQNAAPGLAEARRLVIDVMEGLAGEPEVRRLEGMLAARAEVRMLYVELMHQRCVVTAMGGSSANSPADGAAPAAARPIWHYARRFVASRRFALAASLLLCLGITASVILSRRGGNGVAVRPADDGAGRRQVVAKVGGLIGVTWGQGSAPMPAGGSLAISDELTLEGGSIEIRFDRGAIAVVEGPAQLKIVSDNSMSLQSGKALARVDDARALGFQVITPASVVTDLGTEFGVEVDRAGGGTWVHVLAGRVEAKAVEKPASDATPSQVQLTTGDVVKVSKGSFEQAPYRASPQAFVRSVAAREASKVDVVDLLCGGDGQGERRTMAIDVLRGRYGEGFSPVARWKGDGAYHAVAGLPVVDGCFVPGPQAGPTVVSSAGHRFDFNATDGSSYNHLWAGGPIPWPQADLQFDGKLGGIDYTSRGHGVVLLHANLGVTLDLAKVRRMYPGRFPIAFRGVAGNAAPVEWSDGSRNGARSDVRVLVDGVARLERRGITPADGAISVDVPLRPGDRFLTLVATDGGDSAGHDWVMFGDPVLAMEGAER